MPRSGNRQQRWYLGEVLVLLAGAAAALLAIACYERGLLQRFELQTVDARFDLRGTRHPPRDLVVVQIDDTTFNELGLQWPFPRSVHGRVIRRINADHPAVIAYDVQFTEQTEPQEDNSLIAAVAATRGKVVLATSEVDERGGTNVFGGDDVVRRAHARVGNTAIPPDDDGVLRRVPYSVERLKSFAVVAAETASRSAIPSSAFDGAAAWIDFYGPPGTIPAVSFSRVAQGKIAPGFFSGKVVVVGASSGSLQDVHSTAISGSELMSGPEVEANAISTALRGAPLRKVPHAVDVLLIVLSALLIPVATLGLRLVWAMVVGIAGTLALVVGMQLAFNAGWIGAFVYPNLALVTSAIGVLGASYAATVLKKRVAGPGAAAADAVSTGRAALEAGDFERALDLVGRGQRLWQAAGVPFEAARCRMLLAEACRRLGDIEGATIQLRAAQQAFAQLGAVSDERAAFEALQTLVKPDFTSPGTEATLRTFMFTDVVESTSLIGAIGDQAWAHLHRWHDDTLRELFERHHGEEINQAGDGFFVAFSDADQALECAIDIQRTLADHRRTHGFSPRVRIGLHTCTAMRHGRHGYEGMGVHTAARIGARASGDEILASAETLAQAGRALATSNRKSVTLKGIPGEVDVASVSWNAPAEMT
jgi:CHASE2 domain-containing sensor protein/class 3 adenylate cyclase